ncbi:MAG: triose-phosphate isomerase [Candidatus Adiutrix sp.]|jgi:triosephosphate isomerase|nr:triose-phosphate isomerase [Candidatus Adiutrix sp.]
MRRKPLLAGNWKMFKTSDQARKFFSELLGLAPPKDDRQVAFGVPFTSLEAAASATAGSPVIIAAQDVFWEDEGAYTGEVSAPMIKAAGAGAVIIGHSERRQMFGDTGEWVNKKLRAALKAGLMPILCVGETQSEREGGRTFEVLGRQLDEALAGFTPADLGPLVLAYEPIWAIGTGLTATPDTAQEVHAFLRSRLSERLEKNWAEGLRILYGGSVKPDNVAQLMAQPDIDGALVGGASLEAASFAKIINFDA